MKFCLERKFPKYCDRSLLFLIRFYRYFYTILLILFDSEIFSLFVQDIIVNEFILKLTLPSHNCRFLVYILTLHTGDNCTLPYTFLILSDHLVCNSHTWQEKTDIFGLVFEFVKKYHTKHLNGVFLFVNFFLIKLMAVFQFLF